MHTERARPCTAEPVMIERLCERSPAHSRQDGLFLSELSCALRRRSFVGARATFPDSRPGMSIGKRGRGSSGSVVVARSIASVWRRTSRGCFARRVRHRSKVKKGSPSWRAPRRCDGHSASLADGDARTTYRTTRIAIQPSSAIAAGLVSEGWQTAFNTTFSSRTAERCTFTAVASATVRNRFSVEFRFG